MADTLLLNSDGAPVGFMPLSTLTWQDAIRYMVLDKADVLYFHENWTVRSAHWETQVPSVMMLRQYMKPKTTVRFSRTNIHLRDNGLCSYCNRRVERSDATIDHVLPFSKGGKTTWENCVLSCAPCNSQKSDHTHVKPKFKPYKPDYYELISKRKQQDLNIRYEEWNQFLA
jgi:5-methylcytosine-specific restriction endonuclease McrA